MAKTKDKHLLALDAFRVMLAKVETEKQMNTIRDDLRAYQRDRRTGNPMDHPRYGLSLAYKALDERATQLGLLKYSFGYRKPLSDG